ncbi:MAG: DegV family protein [Anaerolineales bacterium]|nr:DegV family protein [Anaerolineales bacterium]
MSKAKVAIVTDSTANLPADLIEKHNIHVIPLHIHWETDDLLDGIDIKPSEFYRRLEASSTLPTTSQPSVGEFAEFFKRVAERAESIVGIFISDRLSGTLASARAAVDLLPDLPVALVDSESTAMGMGLIVLTAVRAAEQGYSHNEVAEIARSVVPSARVLFVVDTLEYLHKGGRIGGAQRLFGSMLSIKPLLHLEEGEVRPLARIRTKKKAVRHLLDIVTQDSAGKVPAMLVVLSAAAGEEAAEVERSLAEQFPDTKVFIAAISPVVGVHTGPKALGVAYVVDNA